jgi:23S rRNA (uracil1939-C5)-methyltransferase
VRASWNGELLYATDTVRLTVNGVRVELPPGAFIQAARESEEALAAQVADALNGSKKIADLYCGIGTFTFPLARTAVIDAFDGDAPCVASLITAFRRAAGLRAISATARDLTRRPLMAAELKTYDGVVLDPPRAGAEAQACQLARSQVPRIAYVSCHPASFAHDARLLIEGGYALTHVALIDQFLWSYHVELVGVFARRRFVIPDAIRLRCARDDSEGGQRSGPVEPVCAR